MMKIEKIWQDLEGDISTQKGLLYQRFASSVLSDVYVALKTPEKIRCLAIHLSQPFDVSVWNNLLDIKLEVLPDEDKRGMYFLIILLVNNQYKEVFGILSEDLIRKVENINDEHQLLEILLHRLEQWQMLFEKLGQQGLSAEAQRGLFGELFFLRKVLQIFPVQMKYIEGWTGPEKSPQDFQFANNAVEVKTTHGKQHIKIHISNERQLDTSTFPVIFLYHISLDVHQLQGETLNDIVDSLHQILNGSPNLQNLLKMKLLSSGYFENQKDFYDEPRYSIREENIFKVEEGFPKITESDVPTGIGDLKYSIMISSLESWRIRETDFLSSLK